MPRFHLEGASFYSHAIAQWAKPMAVARLAPWSDDSAGVWGTCNLAAQAEAAVRLHRQLPTEQKAQHIGWIESLITLPALRTNFQADDPNALSGPTMQDFVIGVVQRRIASANVCTRLEPYAAVLRDKNAAKMGLTYLDLEFMPSSDPGSEKYWPGWFAFIRQFFPGSSTLEIERAIKTEVLQACLRGIATCGLDTSGVTGWCCADRDFGWGDNDRAALALTCPVPRSHIPYTVGDDASLGRMRREIRGGSGAKRLAISISTACSPEFNRRVLQIASEERVPDVIVYADVDYPKPATPPANRADELALVNAAAIPRLDAHVDLIRSFCNAA